MQTGKDLTGIVYMKKTAKFIVRMIDHMVNLTALLLILIVMFLSCYMLWDSNQVYQAADAKNYEAYIPTEKHTKSFEELQKINPDIIGWIRVNDTNINYPLLQAEDDDTYMNTDAEGKYSLSGSIFLHCANKPDFSDFNNMIYGHHMEKHKMFGDVGMFTDKTYFEKHPYGNLFFDGKDHGVEFYALIQADAYNERIFSICPDDPKAKQAYLQEILDNALYKRNFEITQNDHLVLLITCTSEMTNGRNILVGKLSDQIYPEKEKPKSLGTGIDELKEKMRQVPVICWILLLIIVLWITDRKMRKRGKKI
jgi:sortase B